MKYRLFSLAAALCAAFWLAMPCLALDTTDMTVITSGNYYDPASGYFVFIDDNWGDGAVRCSVQSGMVTDKAVTIQVTGNLSGRLYTSGIEIENADLENIDDPGSYTFTVIGSNGNETAVLSFTIIQPEACQLTEYSMPTGFTVDSVTLNGTAVAFSGSYVDFSQEGTYVVTYHCGASEQTYTLTVNIDHTAPELELAEVDWTTNEAKGPVTLGTIEDGATVTIYLDGDRISTPADGILDSTGDYSVIITDAAGNYTQYNFQIGLYFNISSTVLIVIVLLLAVGFALYLLRVRRKLRIR